MKEIRKVFVVVYLLAVLLSTGTSIWAAEKNETKGIQEVNLVADSERSGTYKEYYCRRKITVHGTKSNPVYFYRGGEHTSVTDASWDKYTFEATIWCWGYSYSSSTGYRYIADITCGGGSSKGQIIRYYIPFSANVTLYSISHTYSFPESVHPHKKYCDCGVSTTATDSSCLTCYPAKIYYDASGGNGAPWTQEETTTPAYLSTVIPIRFPYKFNGWSQYSNSQNGEYYPGEAVDVSANSDKYYYAVWEKCKVLSDGEQSSTYISIGNTRAYFEFTPSETGKYTFESTNIGGATYGSLHNTDEFMLAWDSGGGEGNNFKITYELTGGTTYYYGVEWLSAREKGTIYVSLNKADHEHSYGSWTVVKSPTVDETGLQERICSSCKKKEQQAIPKLDKPVDNSPFKDVKKGDYYYDAVLWAVDNNITAGLSATTFGPHMDCTRGQVVTFLWRASGQPEPNIKTTTFKDLPKNAYYYKAVLWAVEKEITSGYNATTFGSEDKVTRSQFVTFLWRLKGKPQPVSQSTSFTDIPKNAYYYKSVLWAAEKNITAGYKDSLFAPEMSCSRGQVVCFLYRARNIPVTTTQTWTITKCSDQVFSVNPGYREITYTVEWENDSVHTILPQWSNEDAPIGYHILDFEVDMDNRTIEIYMDNPEGLPCWETLVVDLKNNTYYGVGFSAS